MRVVGTIPDDAENRQELLFVTKIFMIGQRAQKLSQEARRENENNNKKKNK